MNKLLNIRACLALIVIVVVGAMTGCSEKGPGGSAPPIDGNLVINIQPSPSAIMSLVERYILTVSGSDMESVVDTALAEIGGFVEFDVQIPIGEKRLFVLEGVRGGPTNALEVIYRGETVAPVRAGAITTLDLVLRPVVPMVRVSPISSVLSPGQPLNLQVEVYNLVNLSSISIDFQWPWDLLGDNIAVKLSDRQNQDVYFSWGHEGSYMGLTVRDTIGGTIVNQQGNGVLANIALQPLVQVGTEVIPFGIFEITGTWNMTILGDTTVPRPLFENAEFRLLPVPDFEVQFPDAILESEVRRVTAVQAPLPIMLSNVTPLTYFSVADLNVVNLSGIESMVNLSNLQVSWNPILNIAPIAGLTRLRTLRAEDIALTNLIALTLLTNLESLYLGLNWIDDISVLQHLTELSYLDLHGNQITDILPLVNNVGLGSGDYVELWDNTALLSDPVQQAHVATLRERGVTVNMSGLGR